jgi:hypothetical protein
MPIMTQTLLVKTMVTASLIALAAQALSGQDLSRYRDFQLGATVNAVIARTDTPRTDVKQLHQRPAVIEEVEWRPRLAFADGVLVKDSIREAVFGFYNDALFRVVVEYDREQTEGLTDADLIEALAATYGPPGIGRKGKIVTSPLSSTYSGAEVVVAQWGAADYALTLFRSPGHSSVGIVLASKRMEALARTAVLRAARLDEQEAPQREAAQQKKQDSDDRAAKAKARVANKGIFKP